MNRLLSNRSLSQPPRLALPQARGRVHTAGSIAGLIVLFTLLRLWLAATTPLLPQEAYYWTWSRHLAWGYFDHPPLASYAIAMTTALFGSTVFGIKSAAVLWSLGWNLLWARLILDLYGDRRLAFWSLLALNLTLVYEAYGVGPTPDGPLLFGWIGTVWAVWRATQSGRNRWWLVVGVFAGLAMLGKYSAVLLLPVVLLYLALTPHLRHWLRHPMPWVAMLLAAAMFTPVVLWNADHQWASFAFQGSQRIGGMGQFKPHFFLLLLITQVAIVTPYLFGLSIAALWRGARQAWVGGLDERTRLLLLSAAVPLLLFTAASLRSHVKINWLAPAYWSLIILGLQQLLRRATAVRELAWGLGSSACLVLAAAAVAVTPNLPLVGNLNSWSGWKEAAEQVDRIARAQRAQGQEVFVFSPNYKISSLLRFYLPGQPRTYAQDIYGARALQFDHFPLEGRMRGATGILVLSDQSQSALDLKRLAPFFDKVEHVDTVQTGALGQSTRRVDIYLAHHYRGHPRGTSRAEGAADAAGGEPDSP